MRLASWAGRTAWPVFRVCSQQVWARHGITVLVAPGRRRGGQLPNSWCPALAESPFFGCRSGGLQHHLVMQGGSCSSQSPETWEIALVHAWEPRSHANLTAPLQKSAPNAFLAAGNLASSFQAAFWCREIFLCVRIDALLPLRFVWVPHFCHVLVTAGFPPLLQTYGRILTRSRWARRCRWSTRCCCSAGPPRGCRRRR